MKQEDRVKTLMYVRSGLVCAFLCIFLFISPVSSLYAAEGNYPDRSITLVVPFSAGGMIDTSARTFAEFLERRLNQPVVISNVTGGGTTIGGKKVVDSKPDGYTLGFFPLGAVIPEVYSFIRKAPYMKGDMLPICRVMAPTISISANPEAPYNTFAELISYAKANPGMKIGTQGVTSNGWLVMSTFVSKKEGVKFINVPFRGGAKIIAALLGAHVPVGTPDYSKVKPLREAGKLKTLAVLCEKRVDFAPDVPSISELGYSMPYNSFVGLFGPKDLPEGIAKILEKVTREVTEDPKFREKCNKMSIQVDYEDGVNFERALGEYKKNLQVIFKDHKKAEK